MAQAMVVDAIKSRIAVLEKELSALHQALKALGATAGGKRGRPAGQAKSKRGRKPGTKMSPEAKAKIAAAQKARWTKANAAKKEKK